MKEQRGRISIKTVLITGANGFIAKNLRAQLNEEKDINVLLIDRNSTAKQLEDSVKDADFIFHIAGVNRPKDVTEFESVNLGLTEEIINHLEKHAKRIPLLITSSTQANLDNEYGKSKFAAEKAVLKWAEKNKTEAYVYRLPGVFGKWSRPNYNSVVATFCRNISRGLDITINNPDTVIDLVYIDTVIQDFIAALNGNKEIAIDGFSYIDDIHQVSLKELSDKLQSYYESRTSLKMPEFKNSFDRYLYATFLSFFDENDFGYQLDKKIDNRGWLAEFIKSEPFGQIFISKTEPGISRGNHWHNTKVEKFLVIKGTANINFRQIETDKVITYKVTGDELRVVDIPVGYVHSITNVGKDELITLFWASEIFNPSLPDTYFQEV